MKRERIYISGPVTGMVDGNRAAFSRVEKEVFAAGFDAENPRRNKLPGYFDIEIDCEELWQFQMKRAVKQLMDCDTIVMLNGWENSKGATIELWLSLMLGLKCLNEKFCELDITAEEISLPTWQDVQRHITTI